ncbi:hypothetical protein CCHL11_05025 [Colletotrichum chlorophyti]|uniref:Mid2 domain-containing protein n=1 Tax=Colletotrichum chlorophyti TaxID=708187 RepID=A0A1Q8S3D2_9PEZI|nr:hypothetical protein CCHL11_05025 [Colletotrichum chlorophyti]
MLFPPTVNRVTENGGGESQNSPFTTTTTDLARATNKVTLDVNNLGDGSTHRILLPGTGRKYVYITTDGKVDIVEASWVCFGESRVNKTVLQKATPKTSNSNIAQPATSPKHRQIRSLDDTLDGIGFNIRDLESDDMTFEDDNSLSLPTGNRTLNELYTGKNMTIELHWTTGEQNFISESRVFSLFNGALSSAAYQELSNSLDGDDNSREYSPDSDGSSSTRPSPGASSLTSSVAEPTGSAAGVTGIGDTNYSTGGNNKGLSDGAIAGIVVGAVLGVALIAFLLWLLFLRRRRRATHVSDGSGHGPHDYLADKEAHARITESPHSPYSDDGHVHLQQQQQQQSIQRNGPEPAIPASAVGDRGHGHFAAPYGEVRTPIAAQSVEDMSRSGARSSTPNVNPNVSHLIEDGMTDDEIRRLEEEERALDAAIEQAGQGHGQRR